MYEKDIKSLLARYRNGKSTEDDMSFLETWYLSYKEAPGENYSEELLLEDVAKVWKQLNPPSKPRIRWVPFAAAVVLIGLIGVWYIKDSSKMNSTFNADTYAEVQPGGNKAYLEIEGGKVISLSAEQSCLVMGDKISYSDGSTIEDLTDKGTTTQNLILTVPRGGIYSVTLPDGTEVWLNSDSKLSYPRHFNSEKREVTLEGEAYFHVKKKLSPFIVHMKAQSIHVLGTSFNASAYADDDLSHVTLVDGSLKVYTDSAEALLVPGQQALASEKKISVKKVNIQKFVAWKDGYFDFTDLNIKEVMARLAKWYDLEIDFIGAVPNIEFYGTINRDNQLSTVLTLLETNGLKYKLSGKKLIIYN